MVNVGLPRTSCGRDALYPPGSGRIPCMVGVASVGLNLEGDGQGDLAGHGGSSEPSRVSDRIVSHWQEQLRRLTSSKDSSARTSRLKDCPRCGVHRRPLSDRSHCSGHSTRVTCYRVGIRMNEPRMPALLTSSGQPGFYFRVLQEGKVGAGDEIVRWERRTSE